VIKKPVIFLILRLIAALILAQSLFYKFTAAAESVELFSRLSNAVKGDASLEGVMRVGSGLVELVAIILLMMKKPAAISVGAMVAVATMAVAMMAHVTVIGIHYGGTPTLFIMAVITFAVSFVVLFRFRGSLPVLGKFT
jgi:hypothetical protein